MKKKLCLVLSVFLFAFICLPICVFAEDKLSINCPDDSVSSKEEFTCDLIVNSSNKVASVEFNIETPYSVEFTNISFESNWIADFNLKNNKVAAINADGVDGNTKIATIYFKNNGSIISGTKKVSVKSVQLGKIDENGNVENDANVENTVAEVNTEGGISSIALVSIVAATLVIIVVIIVLLRKKK